MGMVIASLATLVCGASRVPLVFGLYCQRATTMLALTMGLGVWRLFVASPMRPSLPIYRWRAWRMGRNRPSLDYWIEGSARICSAAITVLPSSRLPVAHAEFPDGSCEIAPGHRQRHDSSVASPIICRSALAIEAHRGVASLANTARYGQAMRLALRSDGCAQPATSDP
ncbi:hypothetical protein [Verminephrobacter eiseniae]|uniref:hypothetical protein n=1 Tax=Verminephrobacter eiseniae TaxID=364317 RepID=UPI002244746A|nr:hypothetical protein [Verminephrobacter eiseniae]MCW5294282.1 hypothetical protein [Verminephrobacter eiseniae]